MKKLINKLKAKPKLYRCLKILGIIFIIFNIIWYLIINIALLVGVSNGTYENEKEKILNVQNIKPIQKAYDYNGMLYLYSFEGDLTSPNFLDNLYVTHYNFFNTSHVDGYYIEDTNFTCRASNWGDLNFSDGSMRSNNEKSVTKFRLYYLSSGSGTTGNAVLYDRYRIDFYSGNTILNTLRFNYYYSATINGDLVYDFSGNLYEILERTGDNFCYIVNRYDDTYAFNLLETENSDYYTGYMTGATQGEATGYQKGYDYGYQVGSTHLDSDPFSLISKAFNAVASVLNTQLFPGFNLGMLVFIPLLVSVIIVVVKVVHG